MVSKDRNNLETLRTRLKFEFLRVTDGLPKSLELQMAYARMEECVMWLGRTPVGSPKDTD